MKIPATPAPPRYTTRVMSGCPDNAQLQRYRAGACSASEAGAIETHLRACKRCRAWFAEAHAGAPFDPRAATPPATTPAGGGPSPGAAESTTAGTFSLGFDESERFSLIQPVISGYEFVRTLGRGGQAYVFEALQSSTKRKVAIKILVEGPYASESQRRRFAREVELVAQLRHANIITIFDSGVTADGRPFYVMDYVRGLPLHNYARENHLSRDAVLRLMATICDGVHFAHTKGVIHRDLKPTNILVDVQGVPRILDFGLAKSLAAPTDPGLSTSQAILGTLPYLAPEQTRGNPDLIDARTDVYALGVILYELLTGQRPYPTASAHDEMFRIIVEVAPLPPARAWRDGLGAEERERSKDRSRARSASRSSRGGCPIDRDVETILLKALAKEPGRRYQSAAQLAADINRYLAGDPISARPDSFIYRARKHTVRFVSRNPVAAGAIVLAFSLAGGLVLGGWIGRDWTPAQQFYERALESDADPIEHVRIIALQTNESLARAAAELRLDGVDLRDTLTLRRMHGRLMERLAAARPRVVAFDMYFEDPHPFSADFVRGVQALQSDEIDVVVATRNWPLEPGQAPQIVAPIADAVRHGSCEAGLLGTNAWRVCAVARRGSDLPVAALALETIAAADAPGADVYLTLDRETRVTTLAYRSRDSGGPGARKIAAPPRTVRLSSVEPELAPSRNSEVRLGDLIGYYVVAIPIPEELQRITSDYADVILASDRELAQNYQGRIVIVANQRPDAEDWFDHPTFGRLHGAVAHAAAIEGLLDQRLPFRAPRPAEQYLWVACGVLPGLAVGGWFRSAHLRRAGVLLLAAVALTALGVAILRYGDVSANPVPPIVGMLLASELSAAAGRASRPFTSHLLERSSAT